MGKAKHSLRVRMLVAAGVSLGAPQSVACFSCASMLAPASGSRIARRQPTLVLGAVAMLVAVTLWWYVTPPPPTPLPFLGPHSPPNHPTPACHRAQYVVTVKPDPNCFARFPVVGGVGKPTLLLENLDPNLSYLVEVVAVRPGSSVTPEAYGNSSAPLAIPAARAPAPPSA